MKHSSSLLALLALAASTSPLSSNGDGITLAVARPDDAVAPKLDVSEDTSSVDARNPANDVAAPLLVLAWEGDKSAGTTGVVTAADDTVTITAGAATEYFIDVLANDAGANLRMESIVAQATSGTCGISLDLTQLVYAPDNPAREGNDQCRYRACDEDNDCGDALVLITVAPDESTSAPTPANKEATQSPTIEAPPRPATAAPNASPTDTIAPTLVSSQVTSAPTLDPTPSPVSLTPTAPPNTPAPTPAPSAANLTPAPSGGPTEGSEPVVTKAPTAPSTEFPTEALAPTASPTEGSGPVVTETPTLLRTELPTDTAATEVPTPCRSYGGCDNGARAYGAYNGSTHSSYSSKSGKSGISGGFSKSGKSGSSSKSSKMFSSKSGYRYSSGSGSRSSDKSGKSGGHDRGHHGSSSKSGEGKRRRNLRH